MSKSDLDEDAQLSALASLCEDEEELEELEQAPTGATPSITIVIGTPSERG